MFKPVSNHVDFAAQEREVLAFWEHTDAFNKLRALRADSPKRFSFIDGPITANNPMGVHHAWGRTYKDLWCRYKAMQGYNQRWQNGFDCQGLWVEVNVEKALNLKNKHDIEAMGMEKFIRMCKERVLRSAAQQTEQTIRLGNWMDWNDPDELRMLADKLIEDPAQHITLERDGEQIHGTVEQLVGQLGMPVLGGSYFTFSNENNYQIWAFLKKCFDKGWVYRGGDVIPWCPRCATGISQHEMDTEGYKDREDPAFTVRMKLKSLGHWSLAIEQSSNTLSNDSMVQWLNSEAEAKFLSTPNKYILAWTTTPWTLAANVMCAVGPKLSYAIVQQKHKDGEEAVYFLSDKTLKLLRGEYELLGTITGAGMVGWTYEGLFDDLPAWQEAHRVWQEEQLTTVDSVVGRLSSVVSPPVFEHNIILWDEVGESEGTGIVHNAPGCGPEDYKLGQTHGTPFVAPLDEDGNYLDGYGPLTGKYGHAVPDLVEQLLRAKGNMYRRDKYVHRYPHCWRCGTPLLYRQVDEWYISMDTLRHDMLRVNEQINWVPSYGKERETDWLHNMHDWMISKKRYWGLALPIWEYADGSFEVIGSYEELKARATEGWETFEGHTPHRPWIDHVKIKHPVTGLIGTRVPDVGNPWLDAGIVGISTMQFSTDPEYWRKWFPGDFMTESFPGQFRNWFYAMIAMSTVMADSRPADTILGFATLTDEKGQPMHKSAGNSIEFNEAADKAGADVMRWLYTRQRYDDNLLFGYSTLGEVRRSVLIPLWNVYSFFVTYALADKWKAPTEDGGLGTDNPSSVPSLSSLDKWILARLQETVNGTIDNLDAYEARPVALAIEKFIEDLSAWYVRRSRERFWRETMDADKQAAYETLYTVLTTLVKLIAPIMPFLSEAMWQNLAGDGRQMTEHDAPVTRPPSSVHHQDYPEKRELSADEQQLIRDTAIARTAVSLGMSVRAQSKVKVRQPLARLLVVADEHSKQVIRAQERTISAELNVKAIEFVAEERDLVSYKVLPDLKKLGKKLGQDLPKVRNALAAMDPMQVAAAVKAGQSLRLEIGDSSAHLESPISNSISLSPDELIVQATPREGLVVAGEAGIVVALDTVLTPALVNEGLAREVVRRINDLRKAADFGISDRIHTTYAATPKLAEAISAFADYIKSETLSTLLVAGEPTGPHVATHEFDGETIQVSIVRA